MSSKWVLVKIWWLGVVFAILTSHMIHHVDEILELPDHPDGQHDT